MTKTKSSRKRLSPGLQKSDDLVSSHLKGDEVKKDTEQSVGQSTEQLSLDELQIIHATSGRVESVLLTGAITQNLTLSAKVYIGEMVSRKFMSMSERAVWSLTLMSRGCLCPK